MSESQNKFSSFKGVFVPSILTILGVILFLRLGWVVGQAGLGAAILIIIMSSVITFITALSISATATNTQVGAGGSYFLISRCFGKEPGAAVGIPLYLAQALGISFYSVGFAESLQLFFPGTPVSTVAFITLVALAILTFLSSDLALKSQYIILGFITLALLSFWLGSPVTPKEAREYGAFEQFGFWEIFAVFFPAVTGIEAGISMSGDLKDPRRSLPIGTISVVLVGCLVYVLSAWKISTLGPDDVLVGNSMIIADVAFLPILIFLGLWGATLSSTMGALLGAPRTLQALAKDRIVPRFLGIGTKKANEPRIALLFSFGVAALGIFAGDLNTIAALLSMFFLTSYGALNLVSGFEGLIDNPSWRPSFRVSWLVSLVGAFLCFGAMFMINPGNSFVAFGAIVLIYYITKKRNLGTNYSDIRTGIVLFFARQFVYKLAQVSRDARNWRPHFLIFSGSPKSRKHLIELADDISHYKGFMTVATIVTDNTLKAEQLSSFEDTNRNFLKKNKIDALAKVTTAENFYQGARSLIQNYGIGAIRPNTIVLGDSKDPEQVQNHVRIIKYASQQKRNIVIVRDTQETRDDLTKGGTTIDVWWGGLENNASLMLTLAYMLKTSDSWLRSTLTLKTVVDNLSELERIEFNLNNFLESSRIPARSQAFLKSENGAFPVIENESKEADIVFAGLKHPDKETDYENYYDRLMKSMPNLKTTVFVLQNEDVDFGNIFS